MSTITATAWVPRGYAAEFPIKYTVDDKELARISKLAKLKLEDAQEDLKAVQRGGINEDDEEDEDDDMNDEIDKEESDGQEDKENGGVKLPHTNTEADDDLREYDLDNYDDDEEESNVTHLPNIGNPRSLAYHDDNADDPYLNQDDDEDEDERDELQILRDDNMVVAARVEDEVAHLEVYVYEDDADNLYVHHDIMLPAIPLCIEWLDVAVGKTGEGEAVDQSSKRNFIAVGTFEPDIEIWDLDTVDCMYPNAILGQGAEEEEEPKVKKKKKKSKKANDKYHTDAVLSLAANKSHRTLLASASADKTIKLWDLNTTKCAKSYSHHTDKVCSIEWSPKDTTVLLSGSYDKTAVVADMRAPDAKVPRWVVESDIEAVRWNPHDANYFFITTENGMIHYYDVRNAPSSTNSKSVWKLQAHDGAVSSFDINPTIPGYLASGSTAREVKLWNVQDNKPSLMVSRNLDVGRVFSTRFAPDAEVAFRLAVAGSKGSLQIWDTSTNPAVRNILAHRIKDGNDTVKERLTGVVDDEDSGDEKHENGNDGWESMEED